MKMYKIGIVSVFSLAGCLYVNAQTAWPKDLPFKNGGKVTIYQPQIESLEGIQLIGRSAISVNTTATAEPLFGAIFYTAYLSTDKDSRIATIDSVKINNAKITGVDEPLKIQKLSDLIEKEVPKWNMEIALDAVIATIRKDHSNAEIYNNDPPKIIYTTKPTTLVLIDGDPIIKKDKDLDADRVLNTPSLIFKEGTQWNMYNGGIWYKSTAVISGWLPEKSMSKKISSINDQIKKQEKENNDGKAPAEKPQATDIVVSTVPAEVIQSKGTAVYKNIDSTSLSYVSNSTDNILKDNKTQSIYILIAGRWYRSTSLNGPWTYNEPDKMPEDFAKIPKGSEKDNVLASIAGTDEAEDAIIDAEIPQTAKVDRKTATVKVEYDGAPKFIDIEGTSLQRAENTNLTILKEGSGKYFALDNGVWFIGNSSTGPWSVATERPKDVGNIPKTSAAYNAKFVYIYEVATDYTIQGYTAGYLGSYIQGDPVIVFGTGFYYRPWYGSIFYPAPCTWGFGFSYNPWYGWGMSYGYNVGFMHVGFYFGPPRYGYGYGGGWFGPPMYRPPYYRPPYGGGGYYGNRPVHHGGGNHYGNNNININNNINNGRNNLYKNKKGQGVSTKDNIRDNNTSKINRPATGNNTRPGGGNNNATTRPSTGFGDKNRPVAKPANKDNNVFADGDGNVYNRDQKGNINQRDNNTGTWKPTGDRPGAGNQLPNNGAQTRPPPNNGVQTRPAPNNQMRNRQPPASVNRDMQMRQNGNNRVNNFNQSQGGSMNRGGGMSRGGGGGGGRRGR